MHNWRLLLLAFFAAFHPTASYKERSFVNGREECCERPTHRNFREARISDETGPVANIEESRLSHFLERRSYWRYEVSKDFVPKQPSATLSERRLQTNIRPDFKSQFERIEYRRISIPDERRANRETSRITINRRVGDERNSKSSVRLSSVSDVRQYDRETRDITFERRTNENGNIRRNQPDRVSRESRREVQRMRDDYREFRNSQDVRQEHDILKRTRNDVTRIINRMDHRDNLSPSRLQSRRELGTENRLSERRKRHVRDERWDVRLMSELPSHQVLQRQSTDQRTKNSESRNAVDELRKRISQNELQSDDRRYFLNLNERRIVRERKEDLKTFSIRSDKRQISDITRRVVLLNDRRTSAEERGYISQSKWTLPLDFNREMRYLDPNARRERVYERIKTNTPLQIDDSRDHLQYFGRRLMRNRMHERESSPVSRLRLQANENNRERRIVDANDRLLEREHIARKSSSRQIRSQTIPTENQIDRSLKENARNVRDSRLNREERRNLNIRRDERTVARLQQSENRLSRNRLSLHQNIVRQSRDRSRAIESSETQSVQSEIRNERRRTRSQSRELRSTYESRTRGNRSQHRNQDDLIEREERRRESNRFRALDVRSGRVSQTLDGIPERVISTTRFNNRINVESEHRIRSTKTHDSYFSMPRENAQKLDHTTYLQLIFYTLQGIYVCAIIAKAFSTNRSDKNRYYSGNRWWNFLSHSAIKVE